MRRRRRGISAMGDGELSIFYQQQINQASVNFYAARFSAAL